MTDPCLSVDRRSGQKPRKLYLNIAVLSALGFLLVVMQARVPIRAAASSESGHRSRQEDRVVAVHAAGKGKPYFSLADGVELPTSRPNRTPQDSSQAGADAPSILASGDIDEDGVPDLIVGYQHGGIAVQRGNRDSLFPHDPEAQLRRAQGQNYDFPFLAEPAVVATDAIDFLAVGDFDADGHLDVVTAQRGSTSLQFYLGDGKGIRSSAAQIDLPGKITALSTGDVNRADGLNDLLVAVSGQEGASLLVFEGPNGALKANPEAFSLPADATSISSGRLDDDFFGDIVVSAGASLVGIYGRDRRLSSDLSSQRQVPKAKVSRRSLAFGARSVTVGDFAGTGKSSLAVLSSDGDLYLSDSQKAKKKSDLSKLKFSRVAHGGWTEAGTLMRARVSAGSSDDLLFVDPANRQIHLIVQSTANVVGIQSADLDVDGEPTAVLPMQLNNDALNDLVIARSGSSGSPLVFAPTAFSSVFTVSNANDSGTGSLREAINSANSLPGSDSIVFSIGSGPQTISLLSPLPNITDSVAIDGTTQPGFAGSPIIELNGSSAGSVNGLNITTSGCSIEGLVINRFGFSAILINGGGNNQILGNFIGTNIAGTGALGNGFEGIHLTNSSGNLIGGTATQARNVVAGGNNPDGIVIFSGSNGNLVKGNFIGTDKTGSVALGNSRQGILIGGASSGNNVGGTSAGSTNVISGNANDGVQIADSGSTGNLIQGNLIGTDASGAGSLGNSRLGVLINFSTTANTVGGTSPSARNVIASNTGGVQLADKGTSNNLIQGNFIGTDTTGNLDRGNGNGVFISPDASDNVVGGLSTGAGNLIAFSQAHGVLVSGGTGNQILSNSITANKGLGINLGVAADGVTANDAGDADTGPNNLQNFPALTQIRPASQGFIVEGSLNSASNATFTLQFFGNPACDASGNGEGRELLGTTQVTTDASGNATISFPISGLGSNTVVTATATDSAGNTSEFSNCAGFAGDLSDLSVVISSAQGTVKPGKKVTYSIVVKNNGPAAAQSVVVTDVLPSPVAFKSCDSTGGGTCGGSGNNRTVSFSQLASGASATITFEAKVSDTATNGSHIVNNVTIASNSVDPVQANNSSTSDITVTTNPIGIACPANIAVNAPPAQSTAIVTYPAPVVSGNPAGLSVTCTPPSGATFPLGSTAVSCTAVDSANDMGACSFVVTVNPPLSTNPATDKTDIDFGAAINLPGGSPPSQLFAITNSDSTPVNVTFASIKRLGNAVTSGKITDADDSRFYQVVAIDSGGAETTVTPGGAVAIPPGQRSFRVTFLPVIPAVAASSTGLAARQVLPSVVQSALNFTTSDSRTLTINLTGRVSTAVRLIDPVDPSRPFVTSFVKNANQFVLKYSAYDSNLDVDRASFQFLDNSGQPVGNAIDVNLSDPIRQVGLTTGQSFSVEQPFSGADSHPEVGAIRLTLFDGETSVTATTNLGSSAASVRSVGDRKVTVVCASRRVPSKR